MGGLFGGRPKGPSLAQKTQDFYTQQQQAQAAGKVASADAASRQALLDQALRQTQTASLDDERKRLMEESRRSGGGYFGATSGGTYLGNSGSSGSRSTFLS